MAKNDLLSRVQEANSAWFREGLDVGWQKCWDFMVLALRDSEVMGKDTFGAERIQKVHDGIQKYCAMYSDAFRNEPESDYLRTKMDDEMRKVFGDRTQPFEERYPAVVRISYGKSRKGWK